MAWLNTFKATTVIVSNLIEIRFLSNHLCRDAQHVIWFRMLTDACFVDELLRNARSRC